MKVLLIVLLILCVLIRFGPRWSEFYEISNFKVKKYYSNIYQHIFNDEKKIEILFSPNDTIKSEREIFIESEKESNLPLIYWSEWKNYEKNKNQLSGNITYCDSVLPSPESIKFNNIYWQEMFINESFKLFLFNAYYDNREQIKRVRVISVTENQRATDNLNLWCLLWFDNQKKSVLSNVSKIYSLWPTKWEWGRANGVYGPQLITCDIPNELNELVPKAITLIKKDRCEKNLDHSLRVIYNKPEVKKQFGVCVQALRFATHDYSVRLIEWLEILKILGADKVYFYKFCAHANMERVLDYYSKKGFVDWRTLTLPYKQPNIRHLFQWYFEKIGGKFWPQELLELNDCLYKNLYRYEYLAIFDIDQIIVPKYSRTWPELMKQIQSSTKGRIKMERIGYYENLNTYVYGKLETDDNTIPKYLYTIRHIYRSEFDPSDSNIKCFHVLRNVEAVHNHFPLKCLGREGYHNCIGYLTSSTKQSYLMHFRTNKDYPDKCDKEDKKKCAVNDTIMWKYYEELNQNMKHVLKNIFNT